MTHTSAAFKTPEGEVAYLAAYGAAMESWPVPYEENQIPIRFGMTHVVTSGPKDAPPLVLLHGFMTTLLMWSPNIADLSQDYRVYAIDTMGHRGRSIPDEPIRDAAGYDAWLTATLNGLGLDRISLMGQSFGAWLALNFSMNAPERVRKLALLSPAACFVPVTRQFFLRAMLTGFYPSRFWFNSFMRWQGLEDGSGNTDAQRLIDLMYLGGKHCQTSQETMRIMPTVFSDDELRALRVPVLLLIGENEVIYDAAEALARARQLIPDFRGELVPGCRHDMSMSQHQIIDARVLEFLNEN